MFSPHGNELPKTVRYPPQGYYSYQRWLRVIIMTDCTGGHGRRNRDAEKQANRSRTARSGNRHAAFFGEFARVNVAFGDVWHTREDQLTRWTRRVVKLACMHR